MSDEEIPEMVKRMVAEVHEAIAEVDYSPEALYLADEAEQVGYQSWIAGYKAAGAAWPAEWPMKVPTENGVTRKLVKGFG